MNGISLVIPFDWREEFVSLFYNQNDKCLFSINVFEAISETGKILKTAKFMLFPTGRQFGWMNVRNFQCISNNLISAIWTWQIIFTKIVKVMHTQLICLNLQSQMIPNVEKRDLCAHNWRQFTAVSIWWMLW